MVNFFFESIIPRVLDHSYVKVLSQQLQDTLAMAYERHPPIEDFTDMDQRRCRACAKAFDLL